MDLLDTAETIARAGRAALRSPAERIPLAKASLVAPIANPPTIRDFSAFEAHVQSTLHAQGLSMDPGWYDQPIYYFHNTAVVMGPGADVPIPPGTSEFDFELEVAAIIAGDGSNWSPEESREHVAGFMIFNDWSARDIQRREMKFSLGPAKGKDSADSLGPYFVTADELEPHREGKGFALTMTARVNGREYCRGSLADIYWSFEELAAYAARGTVVRSGDVIASGTCGSGCILELSLIHGHDKYPWLQPGDLVELEVDGLGTLSNRVADRVDAPNWRQA